jgi:hypothetical protein
MKVEDKGGKNYVDKKGIDLRYRCYGSWNEYHSDTQRRSFKKRYFDGFFSARWLGIATEPTTHGDERSTNVSDTAGESWVFLCVLFRSGWNRSGHLAPLPMAL